MGTQQLGRMYSWCVGIRYQELPSDFALELRSIIDPVGTRRFGHQLRPLPLTQDPTCIFAGDSSHCGNVSLIDCAGDEDSTRLGLLPESFRERKQGLGDAAFHWQESHGRDGFVSLSQASSQQLHKILIDFWALSSKVLEGISAEKAKLAVDQGNNRSRPWQTVEHGEVADDCTRS